jgi:single-stranded-DNA-specific exonuclease
LELDENLQVDAIAFNVDIEKWPNHRCRRVRLAYRLDINEYMGRQSLQLMVEHIEVL